MIMGEKGTFKLFYNVKDTNCDFMIDFNNSEEREIRFNKIFDNQIEVCS